MLTKSLHADYNEETSMAYDRKCPVLGQRLSPHAGWKIGRASSEAAWPDDKKEEDTMLSRSIRAGVLFAMAVGSCATLGPSTAVHAASPIRGRVHHGYQGYLTAAPASTAAPTTLTVQTRFDGVITVTVTPATVIVRHYNGPSGLDELNANDVLQIQGTTTAPGMVTATRIRDLSIQVAYTVLVGQVTAVTPTSVSVVVRRDIQGRAPFVTGSNLTLPVGASTQVISGTATTTGSTAAITVGARIAALGVFNRVAHNFQETFRIRILK